MTTTVDKADLLNRIQNGYSQFEDILSRLSEEQMTTPDVNGSWSVKDNIIHLTVWQNHFLDRLQSIIDGKTTAPEFMPGLTTDDEINEHIYQQNKDRPLAEVLADFRTSYQRVLTAVQSMSEESLNAPIPWSKSGNLVWQLVVGDTYEHYEEHGDTIRRWLESSSNQA
jgi:hypothetical protein